MFFSFVEIKKGEKEIFAIDSLSIQDTPKKGFKNIPVERIPPSLQKKIFEKQEGFFLIKEECFMDAWSGIVRYVFDREAYNSGKFEQCIKENPTPWEDYDLARARRRALIRDAISANINLASEIKGLRSDVKRLYDELKIPYTENMNRFDSMIQKIKEHFPKENLAQYLPKKENFEE